MDAKTYRRLFHETKRQTRLRHNTPWPRKEIYSVQRNRQGEGYDVVNKFGRIVAQGFDYDTQAEEWITNNPPKN